MSRQIHTHVLLRVVAVAMAVALGGCRCNPEYCEGSPGTNCDRVPDAPGSCVANEDCGAEAAVCDVAGSMTCVQCTPDQASACTGTTPTCGDDRACRACRSHAECPGSDACLPDGSCAEPEQVAYVQAGATGAPPCAKGAPCGTLQQGVTAVGASRPFIKVVGTGTLADGATTTIDGKAVTILADPGAKLDRTGDGVILEVRNTGADVRIYDLEITGASGGAGDVGISIAPGGMPRLTLTRVKVANNVGGGISAAGGSLTVLQSTISGNAGGGISVMNGTFVIVGNVFYQNGTLGSLVGGAAISAPSSSANRLEFNSFNQNASSDLVAPGIQCNAVGGLTARNNIISGNLSPTNMDQVGGNCMHTYSIVRPGALPPGAGNSSMDPLFVNSTTGDLHLRVGSPALGAADPNSDLTGLAERDLDGDARRSPADIGADEVP